VAAYNLDSDGIEITLSVRSTGDITGTLTDYTNGLPDIPGLNVDSRPADLMPAPYDFRDPTAVTRTVHF
jgi:hypothetical protein